MSFDRIQLSQEILVAAIGDDWPPDQVEAAIELLANSEGKFPAGVRKLPSELVKAVQRERLVVAMLMAASELGYRETNVQDVIDRAGVSRPTFYEHFSNKEDCFLAAFDTSATRLRKQGRRGGRERRRRWRDRLRRGLEALLEFAVAEPETRAHPDRRGARGQRRRGDAPRAAARALRQPASTPKSASCCRRASYSAITAAGVVGGVEALLYARLCKGDLDDLEQLLPSLMYFAVLPYEGHEAANEELADRRRLSRG